MKYCYKSCKLMLSKFPKYIIVLIIKILLASFQILIPVYVVNKITVLYENNTLQVSSLLIYTLIPFFIYFVVGMINYFIAVIYEGYVSRRFKVIMSIEFYRKNKEIDYDFFDNPDFLNNYNRTFERGVENITNTAIYTFTLLSMIAQSISMFGVVFTIHPIIIVAAFGLGIIYFLIRIKTSKLTYKMNTLQMQEQRRIWYNTRSFSLKDSSEDIKMTDVDKLLLEKNDEAGDNIIKLTNKYGLPKTLLLYGGELFLLFLYPAILVLLVYFQKDNVKVSDLASLTVAASTISTLIMRFSNMVGRVQESSVECKVPFEYIKIKGKIESDQGEEYKEEFEKLQIKNLYFNYHEDEVLKDINFEIKKGQHIAIVGQNGSGKSTLVKLLLRLYDPKSGTIYINDKNYNDINVAALRTIVGAVFQNPQIFATTIGENILLRKPKTVNDFNLIDEALKFSGLYEFVYSLEKNINTEVTKEFIKEGINFSGGQKQRLAIARGYAQNFQLFLLDEPSSALDPLAEAKIYQNLLELGKEKTIIFISHRLTTTVNADQIYLINNGVIVEKGTHEQLIKNNGEYKRMFTSQASKYIGEDYE